MVLPNVHQFVGNDIGLLVLSDFRSQKNAPKKGKGQGTFLYGNFGKLGVVVHDPLATKLRQLKQFLSVLTHGRFAGSRAVPAMFYFETPGG